MLSSIANTIRDTVQQVQSVDQHRAMANAAIQQLAQIGSPDAQYWAQQFQANPEQALRTAQGYGGVDQLTNALRSAQARGQASQAQSQSEANSLLLKGSPDQLVPYAQAGSLNAQAGLFGAKAQTEGANQARVDKALSGVSGGGGGYAGLAMAEAVRSGDATKINQAAKILNMQRASRMPFEKGQEFLIKHNPDLVDTFRESQGYPSREDVRGIVTTRRKGIDTLDEVMRQASILDGIDITAANSGAWEYPINVIMNRILQPDSAVLLGEAAAVAGTMVSHMQTLQQEAKRITQAGGALPLEKVQELKDMALQLASLAVEYGIAGTSDWASQDDALGLRAPERAQTQVSPDLRKRASQFVEKRRKSSGEDQSAQPTRPKPNPIKRDGKPVEWQWDAEAGKWFYEQ